MTQIPAIMPDLPASDVVDDVVNLLRSEARVVDRPRVSSRYTLGGTPLRTVDGKKRVSAEGTHS